MKPKTPNLRYLKKKMGESQRNIDIARSREIPLREILTYEHTGDSILFDRDITTKPDKGTLIKDLEKNLFEKEYCFENTEPTCLVIDFMSAIRKIPFTKFRHFNEAFECLWQTFKAINSTLR